MNNVHDARASHVQSVERPRRPEAVGAARPGPVRGEAVPEGRTFRDVLEWAQRAELERSIKFSAHARSRIVARNIRLSEATLDKLGNAIGRAASKGARESLVLVEDLAFIVSVRSRTVITAVDGPSVKENVFTNIDSAVVV